MRIRKAFGLINELVYICVYNKKRLQLIYIGHSVIKLNVYNQARYCYLNKFKYTLNKLQKVTFLMQDYSLLFYLKLNDISCRLFISYIYINTYIFIFI